MWLSNESSALKFNKKYELQEIDSCRIIRNSKNYSLIILNLKVINFDNCRI